jgi:hypothetical protein
MEVFANIVARVVDQHSDADERATQPLRQTSHGPGLAAGLDPIICNEQSVTGSHRDSADSQLDVAASPVRREANLSVCAGMDGSWSASEDHTYPEFAGHQSGDDESPSLDPDDGGDCVICERLCERPANRCEELRIAKRHREVGVPFGPPERAQQQPARVRVRSLIHSTIVPHTGPPVPRVWRHPGARACSRSGG